MPQCRIRARTLLIPTNILKIHPTPLGYFQLEARFTHTIYTTARERVLLQLWHAKHL